MPPACAVGKTGDCKSGADRAAEGRLAFRSADRTRANAANLPDLAEIEGQESVKRALELAVAGRHNRSEFNG